MSDVIQCTDNMPQWALDWTEKWFEIVPTQPPDYFYSSCLDVITDEKQLALLIDMGVAILYFADLNSS